ncbi:FBP domain-containing protein [Bdellovibrio sp. KM01]|uniref:FBP domain-containing protein n=1 Tax=Bdellovibrio sp. KM01 TaxID=2748865 RepID=UPI0015EAD6F6|nr:FBP domain-containing protein [Bdellovibrio sp. KM01]QLY25239.1 FBP domain-containing protein [Bdellovibrio sp. KM01]
MQTSETSYQTEHVFSISSEEELISCFRERDQKKLLLPDNLRYPFNIRSYFTWKEPSGVYTYLLFKMPNWDMPRGVAFKRTHTGGEPTGGLCNWCNAYGSSEDIGLLSVAMNANVSNSYLICQDLRCIEKIEESAMLAGKNPDKNIADLFNKMSKLFENLSGSKKD